MFAGAAGAFVFTCCLLGACKLWCGGGDSARTFRPRHGHRPGTRRLILHQQAERTLGSGNLREAVALPEGEVLEEWLAMKTVVSAAGWLQLARLPAPGVHMIDAVRGAVVF